MAWSSTPHHLELDPKTQIWSVNRRLNASDRALIGKGKLKKSTGVRGASNKRLAVAAAHAIEIEFDAILEAVRATKAQRVIRGKVQDLLGQAIALRKMSDRSRASDDLDTVLSAISDEYIAGEPMTAEHSRIVEIAAREATPLDTFKVQWLAEPDAKGRSKAPNTVAEYKRYFGRFLEWLDVKGYPQTVEAVGHEIAREYVSLINATAIAADTREKTKAALSSYWKFLIRNGVTESSPWEGKRISKDVKAKKRQPFSQEQIATLIEKAPDKETAGIVALAFLSGGRREEIFNMRISDAGKVLHLPGTKSDNADRYLPRHGLLDAVVAYLAGNRVADSYLVEPASPDRSDNRRGDPFGKRFGRFKNDLFDNDESLTFHSLRHSFVSMCRNSRLPVADAAALVGHSAGFTYDQYGDAEMKRLTESVNALQVSEAVAAAIAKRFPG